MRNFLCKILIFGTILFFVLIVADYCYSALIKASNDREVESWRDVIDGNIKSDIIFLGNSRTWLHIDPHILDSVLCIDSYNLGIDGGRINRQVQKYEIFRERNTKPKVIVQNIDVWSLEYRVGYELEQFFPFFWDKEFKKMFIHSEPFTFAEKYFPFYRYHGIRPKDYLHSLPHALYKGYQGRNIKWNGEMYMQQDSIEFFVNDTTFCIFDSYLSKAKKENISLIFVYAPLYHGTKQKISNIDEMYQTYQGIADKYGIPILDYSDMWICYDTTYFYNAMHLNRTGAEIFSDSLANDIKSLKIL